jgi:hypothetical protein
VTTDEARVAIASSCPWFAEADLSALLDPRISPEELGEILAVYTSQPSPPSGSAWETILGILKIVSDVAGYVLPGVGVVQAIIAAIKG